MSWKRRKQNRTGRSLNISSFFLWRHLRPAAVCAAAWARFAVCHARAAWRARYSSVTLAPRGELVIHLSRSHRVASSFFFIFLFSSSIGGAFVPFHWKRASHYVTTLFQRKGIKAVIIRSIIVVSPSSCRCPCSWSHRCLRLCRSPAYLSHLVRITKIAAVTRSSTCDYLSRAMIAVDHFGIFCPRHFAISLTKKEAALGSNLRSNDSREELSSRGKCRK